MGFEGFKNRIWLASPTMHGDEQKFVQEAFDTNWVSTVGANLNELEKSVCEYVGCNYGVALSAGTAAIHMAIKLAGVQAGDIVFCTDMTFVATVNPVLYEKAVPVFIDEEYETWNMSPVALRRAFEKYNGFDLPKPKAVIVVNLYGTPAKLDEIRAICDEYEVMLIEDAAESLGATYKGVQTGTFGSFNAISFNGNKIVTTSGGGMLLTNDKDSADKVRFWSTQARENYPWYHHKDIGYNYRMSNITAGIGRGQMMHLDEHISLKKAIYTRYKKGFKELPISMNPYDEEIMQPNFWLSCMLIDENAMCHQDRSLVGDDDPMAKKKTYIKERGKSCPDEIREVLADINVESRPIWKPMHMQPVYDKYDYITAVEGEDVGADIFQRGLCLPSDITMTEDEQNIIIEVVEKLFHGQAG